jgi:hypothetical protein
VLLLLAVVFGRVYVHMRVATRWAVTDDLYLYDRGLLVTVSDALSRQGGQLLSFIDVRSCKTLQTYNITDDLATEPLNRRVNTTPTIRWVLQDGVRYLIIRQPAPNAFAIAYRVTFDTPQE